MVVPVPNNEFSRDRSTARDAKGHPNEHKYVSAIDEDTLRRT